MEIVNVKDDSIFNKLIEDIDAFIWKNKENVQKVDDFIFEKEGELQKTKNLLEQRLVEAQHLISRRQMEIAICKQKVEFDENGNRKTPNCRSEENNLIEAQRQEKAAVNALNDMNEILRFVKKVISEYDYFKNNIMELLDKKLPDSQTILERHNELINSYTNLEINKNI